ncbi:MAG: hypothetical protein IT160_20310 [Bryobacterales bacterium]|nr:hypothetical protein [Bryobacterales bacterium]
MIFCLMGEAGATAAAPQLVWQGDVDQVVVLSIQAKRLKVEVRSGAPILNPSFHFAAPLPDSRQPVRLEVIEGRGHVEILQRPTLENDYRLSIRIEDPQDGIGHYSLAIYWDTGHASFHGFESPGRGRTPDPSRDAVRRGLRWSARVHGTVLVTVEGSRAAVEPATGADHVRARFDRPLTPQPDRAVSIEKRHGRGEVRVLAYPTRANNYRLVFEVADPGAGDSYVVDVLW